MGIRRRASIEARILAIGVCGMTLLFAVPSVVQGVPIEINFSLGGGRRQLQEPALPLLTARSWTRMSSRRTWRTCRICH